MMTALQSGNSGGWAGNGVMNTTMLAERFGLTALPLGQVGGTNFANGGATTVYNAGSMVPGNVCTLWQIDRYLTAVNNVANPNAIYLIKTGDNDVTWYYSPAQTAFRNANPTYLSDGATALAGRVANLQAAGARTIVVRNSYDSALMAGPGGDVDPILAPVLAASQELGRQEWAYMAGRGVRFVPVDNNTLFSFIAHNPTLFGFDIDTVQATNAPFAHPHVSAAFDVLSPYQQAHYLFIDGVHLTTAGQTIEADLTYSMIVAPSQMSLLAESVVQGGWTRAATIQGQIEAPRCGTGRRFWTSAGVFNTKVSNAQGFANDSGSPLGGSIGLDYRLSSGLILGAAMTVGSQIQRFSTGGHFEQVEETPSVYVAYFGNSTWGSAVLSYNLFQDNIQRQVPLGIFTDQNNANTTGQSLALALRGGRNVTVGRMTTGPVAGLIMQEARVYGFTETSSTGITPLSFDRQTRESVVGQLGWRVSVDANKWQPYMEVNWNHELACQNRMVGATLTSAEAPTYYMDAATVGLDWGTLALGSYYKLGSRAVLRGGASAMFANPQMQNYGGDVGLNVCF
jgi:outer membrane lipase/esterase